MESVDESLEPMTPPVALPESHLFEHDAMHSTFSLRLISGSGELASGVARECFELLDGIESKLSRFIDGSDVSRINRMQAGETLYLSEPCHQCLLLAMEAYAQTGGLFDITQGTRIEHRKSGAGGLMPALQGTLVIHPDVAAITCQSPGREIDLGGIGKGYALDQIKNLLLDWGIEGAMLTAGASTLLAFGPQSWPVQLTADHDFRHLALANRALSASGTDIQGSHIVHPYDDESTQAYLSKRVWVVADTATLAEGWSTALMLINPGEVADIVSQENAIQRAYAEFDGRVRVLK